MKLNLKRLLFFLPFLIAAAILLIIEYTKTH